MTKISEALTYGLTIRESATDGSDFTNPTADYRRLFLGEDGSLHLKDSAGAVTDIGGGSVAEITDIPTAETDDTLRLAPDGAGGVEWAAGGGGAPLGVLRYAAGSDTYYTGGGSQADMDATNATVTFTAPASGNVIVVCTVLAGSAGYMGIREGSTDLIGPELVTSATGGGIMTWRLGVLRHWRFAWFAYLQARDQGRYLVPRAYLRDDRDDRLGSLAGHRTHAIAKT